MGAELTMPVAPFNQERLIPYLRVTEVITEVAANSYLSANLPFLPGSLLVHTCLLLLAGCSSH